MASPLPDRLDHLRKSLNQRILDQIADALSNCSSIDDFNQPVLRLEAFVQEGNKDATNNGDSSFITSQLLDLSEFLTLPTSTPARLSPSPPSHDNGHDNGHNNGNIDPDPKHDEGRKSHPVTSDKPASRSNSPDQDTSRRIVGTLRPAPDNSVIDTHRQMEVAANNFPKRAKNQSSVTATLEQPTVSKFVNSLWEQLHCNVSIEPQRLEGLAMLNSFADGGTTPNNKNAITASDKNRGGSSSSHKSAMVPTTMAGPAIADGNVFSHNNIVCRRVTQASRTCRSVEVIVQACWIEAFDDYVDRIASSNPTMSQTKCRRVALMEACRDFNWSEKELRNKMAVWRGYKDVKDAAGWPALIFSGMGLYRFCKYRIGLNQKGLDTLRRLRPSIAVAADTLHPQWRQLLAIVGQDPGRPSFTGHPHDWVINLDGSDPVPLRSTYIASDPFFTFEHLQESTVDSQTWGDDVDPRYVPPVSAAAPVSDCHTCGQTQSDDPTKNSCFCYPSLFGGPRRPATVQVFRTPDHRNNGLLALTPAERGVAIGEFVGLVTKDVEGLDVMKGSTGRRPYQIWQGRHGNYTRFINHSCNPNAQFQHFVWLSIQRIILVSKGIDAGSEITVDYSQSYWSGLNKRCLCGERCCRYSRV